MDTNICSATRTLLFACAGGSSVGQLTNDVCRALTAEGAGKLYCLAGIGGHVQKIVDSAKDGGKVVAVDGCGVKCALKVLEAAGVPITQHVVLTDWGMEKSGNLFPSSVEVAGIKERIMMLLK